MNTCNIIIFNLTSKNFWLNPKIKNILFIVILIAFLTSIIASVYLLGYFSCFEKCIFLGNDNNIDIFTIIGEGSIFLSLIILCIMLLIITISFFYLIAKYCIFDVYPLLIQYPNYITNNNNSNIINDTFEWNV